MICGVVVFSLSSCGEPETDDTSVGGDDGGAHVHSFTLEKVEDVFLKTSADCQHKAVYYKSCECGEVGT